MAVSFCRLSMMLFQTWLQRFVKMLPMVFFFLFATGFVLEALLMGCEDCGGDGA